MLKRMVTCEQLTKDYTRSPDIRFLGVIKRIVFSSVKVLFYNLRCMIVVSTFDAFQSCQLVGLPIFSIHLNNVTHVNQFNLAPVAHICSVKNFGFINWANDVREVKHNILGLKIHMDESVSLNKL